MAVVIPSPAPYNLTAIPDPLVPAQAKTYVPPREQRRKSIGSALVLLGALNVAFGILSVFMTRNHAWTDEFMASLPIPGTATSMAADRSLMRQVKIGATRAWYARLADQSSTLVAETEVSNESALPVTKIVVEAHAYDDGVPVRTVSTMCGLSVSQRLIGRLTREELAALLDLAPPSPDPVAPGETIRCQLAFPGLKEGAEEVAFRIASVEPYPGHSAPRLLPAE
jgi:hypothetical protein